MAWASLEQARLQLVLKLVNIYVAPKAKFRAFIARVLGRQHPDLAHATLNATIKWLSKCLSIEQFRAVTSYAPDPRQTLLSCKTLLADGAVIEEVREETFQGIYLPKIKGSTRILMHIHGGGFVSGSPETSSTYLLQLSTELQARGFVADIFSIRYDLSPEAPFPTALRQVCAAYEYLRSQGKPIILVGESAGGNLCLAFLVHLYRKQKGIAPEARSCPDIVGVYLSSPWINLEAGSKAFHDTQQLDCLDSGALKRWRNAYIGDRSLDEYASPMMVSEGWDKILPPNMCIMSGDLDLLKDDILTLASTVEENGYRGLHVDIAPLKGHVWNLVDFGAVKVGRASMHLRELYSPAYDGVVSQSQWIVEHCL